MNNTSRRRISSELRLPHNEILDECEFIYNDDNNGDITMSIRFIHLTLKNYPFAAPICYINLPSDTCDSENNMHELLGMLCNIPTDIWSWRLLVLMYPEYKKYIKDNNVCVCCCSCLCRINWCVTNRLDNIVSECLLFAQIIKLGRSRIYSGGQYLKMIFERLPEELITYMIDLNSH